MKKLIFITGSTDGIGKALGIELLKKDYEVIFHGRKQERLNQTLKEVKDQTGITVKGYLSDLADFEQVTRMCEDIQKDFDKIDVFIHNAGTYEQRLQWNPDKIEKTMAVNFVSNVLINEKLFSFFSKSKEERKRNNDPMRIILVSSIAHQSGRYSFNDWFYPKSFNGYMAYANSKMAQIMYGYYIADIYKDHSITVNSLHPGVIDTKILRENFGMRGAPITEGIKTSLYLATSDEVKSITGKYFNNSRIDKSSSETYIKSHQQELYMKTKEVIKKYL
ncbi:MAG: SDR family NAD(P)-dependent oxidoreductase [Leptospiraceae bacterium]|nr:SDR family NAD(P)-dependent oxidoreductase [Leptospiraceae bacterium]MDW7975143.1 SDR family NAD(P)-dependent oxidoreductase [Leptospiraceae bacterium]